MNTTGSIRSADEVTYYRQRHLISIMHIHASRGQTGDNGALNHTRGAVRVTIDAYHRAFGQNRTVGRTQLGSELRCEIDIDEASHAIAAKETTSALRTPDDAGVNNGPGLNLLIRPDFDIRLDNCALLYNRVIADDRSLEHDGLALDAGR